MQDLIILTKEEELCCCTGGAGKAQGSMNGFPEDGAFTQASHGGHNHTAEYVPVYYLGPCMVPARLKPAPGCRHVTEQVGLAWGQLRERVEELHQSVRPSIHTHLQSKAVWGMDMEGYGTSHHNTASPFIVAA